MISLMYPSRLLIAAAAFATLAIAGCRTGDPEPEPEPDSVALTVGSQNITVSNNGTVTGGPITITRPATPTITAVFRRADGVQDAVSHGANFEVKVTPANTGVLTFTRSSAFSGTLTGVAAGSTQLSISLFHKVENHDDFGPFNVPVTVN